MDIARRVPGLYDKERLAVNVNTRYRSQTVHGAGERPELFAEMAKLA